MRMLPLLVILPLCAAPALAQTAAPPPTLATATTGQAMQPEPAEPAPAAPAPSRHSSWERHFDAANTTHDGHLTLEQAKSRYVTVARHFNAIDAGHKGYVTTDDIRAWHKARRETHHPSATHSNRLQPRPAMHRTDDRSADGAQRRATRAADRHRSARTVLRRCVSPLQAHPELRGKSLPSRPG